SDRRSLSDLRRMVVVSMLYGSEPPWSEGSDRLLFCEDGLGMRVTYLLGRPGCGHIEPRTGDAVHKTEARVVRFGRQQTFITWPNAIRAGHAPFASLLAQLDVERRAVARRQHREIDARAREPRHRQLETLDVEQHFDSWIGQKIAAQESLQRRL